jgi:hypothetical protein
MIMGDSFMKNQIKNYLMVRVDQAIEMPFKKPIYCLQNFNLTSKRIYLYFLIITLFSMISLSTFLTETAFGDGLSQEQISSSLGNRKADLLIKMTPPVITTETLREGQKPIIELRLYDSNTNSSFNHVTYYVSIEKDGKKLLSDWFHAHNGDLGILIIPQNTSEVKILSKQQDPLIGSYIGTYEDPVTVTGPIFLSGGLYHFKVRIATVDSDTGVLPQGEQRIYDSWMSIGNTEIQQINTNGKQIPLKITSYYDKINGFKFDNNTKQMQFTMPFNWNLSRINKTSIFVHEELSVPKPNPFGSNISYSGTVNGVDVSKDVMLDNSQNQKEVIHVMLPKNTIIQIADNANKKGEQLGSIMKFILEPKKSSSNSASMVNMGNVSMS